ncbi:hypothetical protein QE152_g24475 [Popillia japonica]|uniref:Uncharacterized protein n=1 Tax=Popillia japonica TaxID=7064 RepID=A0AAW1KF21_POPJA
MESVANFSAALKYLKPENDFGDKGLVNIGIATQKQYLSGFGNPKTGQDIFGGQREAPNLYYSMRRTRSLIEVVFET